MILSDQERTKDLYEQIPGYPKPPLIPLPDEEDYSSLESSGLILNKNSRFIIKLAFKISGFQRFRRKLSQNLEEVLRKVNIRGPGLFAPAIAASLAIDDDPRELTPFQRAATLLIAARQFHQDLMTGTLEPDRYKEFVLEMGQYPNLFATHLDVQHGHPIIYKSKNTSNILVIRNGKYFIINAGALDNSDALARTFQEIDQQSNASGEPNANYSPGILTCATDQNQIKIFTEMHNNPTNANSLELIRNTFLTLCLDLDSYPQDAAECALISQSKNFDNRWHHASVQLVVFGNAKACLIGNFSAYLDGNVQMRAAEEFYERACKVQVQRNGQRQDGLPFEQLKWELQDQWFTITQADLAPIIDDQAATFTIENIGRERFNAVHVDPVAAFILALAVCSHKLMGETPHISQFVSLSRYRCMDVDSPMITTPELAQFVDYMTSNAVDPHHVRELVDKAIQAQFSIIRNARKYLSLSDMIYYYLWSLDSTRRFIFKTYLLLTIILLRKLKLINLIPREVVISHPSIYAHVPIVGRPGVRLPYAKYFGLHYQIHPNRIVITMMPGVEWKPTNHSFIATLTDCLNQLLDALESTDATQKA